MSELQMFNNLEFGTIRTYNVNGEPYFVGKDITEVLGYANHSKALLDHVDEEDKLNNETLSSLGQRGGWLVNESGLYCLIVSSKMPEAKKFKRWVTSEVLPTIRKKGAYMTENTLEQALTNPDFLIKLATELKEEQTKRKELALANSYLVVENHTMRPKADYFDALVDRNALTSFRETAKLLQIREKTFITFLINKKFLYRDSKGKLVPYAEKNAGLFETKEWFNSRTNFCGTQHLVTAKGREKFRILCQGIE